jgi:hypothetical protein
VQQSKDIILEELRAASSEGAALAAASGDLVSAKAIHKATVKRQKDQRRRAGKAAKKAAGGSPAGGSALPALPPPISPVVTGGDAAGKAAASKARIEAEVHASHPPISGRKACAFFFGPKRACNYDSAACPNGHHGQ